LLEKKIKPREKKKTLDRSQYPIFKEVVIEYDTSNNPIKNKSPIQRNMHPFRPVSVLSYFAANSIYGKIKNNNNIHVVVPTNPSINPPISDQNKRVRSDTEKKLIELYVKMIKHRSYRKDDTKNYREICC
jgi:hypothetical protein